MISSGVSFAIASRIELSRLAPPRSLLDIPHFASNITGGPSGDRRTVTRPHEVFAVTGNTRRRFPGNEFIAHYFRSARRDQIFSFTKTAGRNISDETDVGIPIRLRLLLVFRDFDDPDADWFAAYLLERERDFRKCGFLAPCRFRRRESRA